MWYDDHLDSLAVVVRVLKGHQWHTSLFGSHRIVEFIQRVFNLFWRDEVFILPRHNRSQPRHLTVDLAVVVTVGHNLG